MSKHIVNADALINKNYVHNNKWNFFGVVSDQNIRPTEGQFLGDTSKTANIKVSKNVLQQKAIDLRSKSITALRQFFLKYQTVLSGSESELYQAPGQQEALKNILSLSGDDETVLQSYVKFFNTYLLNKRTINWQENKDQYSVLQKMQNLLMSSDFLENTVIETFKKNNKYRREWTGDYKNIFNTLIECQVIEDKGVADNLVARLIKRANGISLVTNKDTPNATKRTIKQIFEALNKSFSKENFRIENDKELFVIHPDNLTADVLNKLFGKIPEPDKGENTLVFKYLLGINSKNNPEILGYTGKDTPKGKAIYDLVISYGEIFEQYIVDQSQNFIKFDISNLSGGAAEIQLDQLVFTPFLDENAVRNIGLKKIATTQNTLEKSVSESKTQMLQNPSDIAFKIEDEYNRFMNVYVQSKYAKLNEGSWTDFRVQRSISVNTFLLTYLERKDLYNVDLGGDMTVQTIKYLISNIQFLNSLKNDEDDAFGRTKLSKRNAFAKEKKTVIRKKTTDEGKAGEEHDVGFEKATFSIELLNSLLASITDMVFTIDQARLLQEHYGEEADTGNLFYVQGGQFLIPVSWILQGAVEQLTNIIDKEYLGQSKVSLTTKGDLEAGKAAEEKNAEKKANKDWNFTQGYGQGMISIGSKYGDKVLGMTNLSINYKLSLKKLREISY